MALQGICKDCGNVTLNNELVPTFRIIHSEITGLPLSLRCLACGSYHVDVIYNGI